MKFAYLRVSTARQELDRQRVIAEKCEEVFEEKVSARAPIEKRTELARMLDKLRAGDEVYCLSIDRLSRDVGHLLKICDVIREKKATLYLEKERLRIAPDEEMSATDKLMLQVFAIIAEFERSIMLERQAEARAAAVASGKYRKSPVISEAEELEIVRRYNDGVTVSRIVKDSPFKSRTPIYNVLKKHKVKLRGYENWKSERV
ncbi:recombinase family protein [Dermabacter sp. HMSC08H10]|uniref:recombinase family protein n=1 Tax=Dermabacter sp. HMSC08H10 TaxID=1581144 RepID=UPI0008A3AC6E|nr:recombinase family protein [Dermabacter sp. HMSC08H10]OFT21859.1 hypothetical protein HMPREF3176_00765 [Dermabacter sp. HMSC08H10]